MQKRSGHKKGSLIFQTVSNGDITMIKYILNDAPQMLNAHNDQGWSPLHLAARFGQIDCAKYLLDCGADINIKSTNPMRNNPLHAAVSGNQADMVKVLIDCGADVNSELADGWRAIHGAAQMGFSEVVKILIEKGADPKAKNNKGKSPYQIATENDHQEIVELLEKYNS